MRSRTASVEGEINLPRGYEPVQGDQDAPNRRENNAPRRTNPAITSDNIVAGKRTRGSAHAVYLSTFAVAYLLTFASAINPVQAQELHEPKKVCLHRDHLPPPPKRWSELERHPFGNRFKRAGQAEIDDILRKGCFKPEAHEEGVTEGEILPLMWVFTYKFDEDGYLTKFKARLVVRGDLQQVYEDTYAATLAARIFRFLVALMAAFGLKAFQYDVLNAFLNAEVNRKIYVQTPEGYVDQFGPLLRLWRALYGLKEAPLLWYNSLCASLKKMGLKPVPGIPCLFTNEKLIVFFYIDDIVVLVRPEDLEAHEEFERALKNRYEIRCLGKLSWFLGIRVIHNEEQRKVWLLQDSFIDKVAASFKLQKKSGRYPATPLNEGYIGPSDEEPNAARTKEFQSLTGSLVFISCITRPDVAKAHSVLAQHLQNPSQKHLAAAKHVWEYLIGTQYYSICATALRAESASYITEGEAIEAGVEPLFFGASDAAFADNLEMRRSSHGFMFKLYGMPIDWKATVQRSVTKSTTEAELMALSVAGAEMEWWQRAFKSVKFELEFTPQLWCDNTATVGIVTKREDRLQTKLRHVDTHQMWLRQEVEQKRIQVSWVPTDQMPADGLTKILPRPKHEGFVKQLGLEDIQSRVTPRENEEAKKRVELSVWN
jgi:hypothetical protein